MKAFSLSLFAFAFIFFFYIVNQIPGYELAYQIILFSPCFLLLRAAFKGTNGYYSGFLFLIFYTLGYPIYLAVMYLTIDEYTIGGWMGIGNFNFESEQLKELSLAGMLMMFGIVVGINIFNKIMPKIRRLPLNADYSVNVRLLKKYITYWFIGSMALILFMAVLGLGRTGLQDATILPFGIKGFLYYFRVILVPLIGLFLLGKAVESKQYRLKNVVLVYLFIIAISVALAALSRSDLVLILGPALLIIITHHDAKVSQQGKGFALKVVLVVIASTQLVQLFRNLTFTSEGGSGIGFSDISDALALVDFQAIVNNVLSLLTVRQGGARDMAVALNSSYQSISYIWDFFWQINEQNFMIDVWGFELEAFDQDGKSYGTGFNGFGWYGFGRNLPIVFVLSLLTGVFAGWMEYIFVKLRAKGAQLFVAIFIPLMLWNSFVWGRFWRIVPMLILGAYIINRINLRLVPRVKAIDNATTPCSSF
jgi:hypothetical protein